MKIADAQLLWSAEPGWLNTATYGLPPTPAWDAVQSVLADWRSGLTSWEKWGESTERSRESFARLVGVRTDQVAVGATVSELIGLVAAGVPDGARVVTAEGAFTSLLFPWLVHADRGIGVQSVPVSGLADAVARTTRVVACRPV